MVGPLLLAAQRSIQASRFLQFGLEKLEAGVLVAFVIGQACFRSDVEAADVTRVGFAGFQRVLHHRETDPQMARGVPLDRDGLGVALKGPGKTKRIHHTVDKAPVVACICPARLLACEAAVQLDLLETRGPCRDPSSRLVGKEALVGFIVPLGQRLNRLAAHHLPMSKARRSLPKPYQVALRVVATDMLAGQPVVAAPKGHDVLPDEVGHIDVPMKSLVALAEGSVGT